MRQPSSAPCLSAGERRGVGLGRGLTGAAGGARKRASALGHRNLGKRARATIPEHSVALGHATLIHESLVARISLLNAGTQLRRRTRACPRHSQSGRTLFCTYLELRPTLIAGLELLELQLSRSQPVKHSYNCEQIRSQLYKSSGCERHRSQLTGGSPTTVTRCARNRNIHRTASRSDRNPMHLQFGCDCYLSQSDNICDCDRRLSQSFSYCEQLRPKSPITLATVAVALSL